MKEFYYARNSEKFGPYSLVELRFENITPQTLIWFEGLPSWQYAEDVEEIQSIFHPVEQVEVDEPAAIEEEKEEEPGTPVIEAEDISQVAYAESTVHEVSNQYTVLDNNGFFKRPFSFNGRIRRTEWWVSVIIVHITTALVAAALESNTSTASNGLAVLLYIPIIWFALAQGTKRCHDRGNSGFFILVPFYALWLAFGDSDVGQNEYGTNPKGRDFQ
ncbi:DUF805 domain-containing protein [Sphingobacterium alkalisoli]|uniref:DUF805 domain-containing protein n=1 Tax=Sphingobacterium alkalisoli TaxID=1874115 RepID=A0A4U0H1K7_9SPHI|nr:DUF805 domain-containing protein [Sphingobacterium alkalisoli]TJY65440.1 DUF805 domain-containing protein [Sphingobacterium alkalisoli]GGH20443.1 hypothetical protein GCM10011418_25650 [Sphingobacterium alkalisoli]